MSPTIAARTNHLIELPFSSLPSRVIAFAPLTPAHSTSASSSVVSESADRLLSFIIETNVSSVAPPVGFTKTFAVHSMPVETGRFALAW